MKIGFSLPQIGAQAHQAAGIAEYAAELERAGAHSLWVAERLIAATNPKIGYGGSSTIPALFNSVLDPFVVLGLAAAATNRVRLGTNVLIAPLYKPAMLARSLTTLEVASNGRLDTGLGIGWSPDEYEAAGVPFSQRGARLDEMIDALKAIWTNDPASYTGKYVSVPEHRSELKSLQRPHPPIHLSGTAPAALTRIGHRADGWLPMLSEPGQPETDAHLVELRTQIDRAAEEAGRDPASIATVVRVNVARGTSDDEILATVETTAKVTGFDHFLIELLQVGDDLETMTGVALRLLQRCG
ncbi:TIGR03619 family F420-dependent LLM class oxidoreductase [Nocardia sp. CA-136227]|uniref:TIGR03619 family F420-dependent LLM class oxidoreductase n=1 Tax=Nocardia sp. CA-136227 TaxID=3239979 RepID=UPI003D99F532